MTPTPQELRTLLEAAAKACGIEGRWIQVLGDEWFHATHENLPWQPHINDGDCARMEDAADISIERSRLGVVAIQPGELGDRFRELYADHNNDRQAARRWASLRAAAACTAKE